jgi:hypothetical protein
VTQDGSIPIESPDGKFVYYLKGGYLWKVPVGGGKESQVFDFSIVEFNLAIVDKGIYFVPKPQVAPGFSIRFFSFATRQFRQIASSDRPVAYVLSVSPDRRWILYSQLDQRGSDLMLVDNFQ